VAAPYLGGAALLAACAVAAGDRTGAPAAP
jgi:hypothetical protein